MKRAIYAGSFDLPTVGHEWMIKQGKNMFDELIVGVGINPYKKYTFDVNERIQMMKKITKNYGNVKVVGMTNQYLKRIAAYYDCEYILRGLRCSKDFEEEIDLRDFNSIFTSVYLIPPPTYRKVSSSFVKGLIGYNDWEQEIHGYIPNEICTEVINKFKYYGEI